VTLALLAERRNSLFIPEPPLWEYYFWLRISVGSSERKHVLQSERHPADLGRYYRILSIDGGGIRGAFPAALLAWLEERIEHPIASYFDLGSGLNHSQKA
jgi:hypothetical protein